MPSSRTRAGCSVASRSAVRAAAATGPKPHSARSASPASIPPWSSTRRRSSSVGNSTKVGEPRDGLRCALVSRMGAYLYSAGPPPERVRAARTFVPAPGGALWSPGRALSNLWPMRSSHILSSVAGFTRRSSVLGLFLIAASCSTPHEQKAETADASPKAAAPKIAEQKPAAPKPAEPKGAAPKATAAKGGAVAQGASMVERLTDLGKNDNHVQEHLEHLTKSIGPRLTGSSNLKKAQDWAVAQFQSFGLEAHLEQWGEFPVGFDRGPSHGGMVAPEKRDYTFITSSWTPGTSGAARGPAYKFPSTDDELAALKGKLEHAWLVRAVTTAQPKQEFVDAVRKAMLDEGAYGEIRGGRGDLLVMSG